VAFLVTLVGGMMGALCGVLSGVPTGCFAGVGSGQGPDFGAMLGFFGGIANGIIWAPLAWPSLERTAPAEASPEIAASVSDDSLAQEEAS